MLTVKPAAVVFDLMGTLLDVGSLREAAAVYSHEPAAFVATWREKQLAYAFTSTILGKYEDFDALTRRALEFAARRHGLSQSDRNWEALADSWRELAPYPEVKDVLEELRDVDVSRYVLTNATSATARAALHAAGLSQAIDATLSVEAVRTYKPDARVYELATQQAGTTANRLLFVTSNSWDATGAGEFGIPVVWCNRAAAPAETFGVAPVWTIADLRELPRIVRDGRSV